MYLTIKFNFKIQKMFMRLIVQRLKRLGKMFLLAEFIVYMQLSMQLACALYMLPFRGGLERITQLLLDQNRDKTEFYIVRYVFQPTLYDIWKEHNQRKNGERPMSPSQLIQMVDKNVRYRLSSIRAQAHTGDLALWFAMRQLLEAYV